MNGTGGILVVGEALVDVVHPADGGPPAEHVGGSPANVAMGLARLGHPSWLSTHVGTDERGDRIAATVHEAGAGLAPGSRTAERTPTAVARLDAAGAAQYTFDLTWQYDAAAVQGHLDATGGVGHVHTGSLAAVIAPGAEALREHLQRLRATHTLSYDPNARPGVMGSAHQARAASEQFVALADVVKCSDEDLAWFQPESSWEDAAGHLLDLGPQLVVVTRGGEGATALLRTGEASTIGEVVRVDVPAPSVRVADTVGAGDSFMAGLLSGLLEAGILGARDATDTGEESPHRPRGVWRTEAVQAAVERGVATAAWTVQRPGAGGPSRAELPGA